MERQGFDEYAMPQCNCNEGVLLQLSKIKYNLFSVRTRKDKCDKKLMNR